MSPEVSFFIVTFAFGTTAPPASATVPLNVPVNCCAKQVDASRMRTSRNAAALAAFFTAVSSKVEIIAPPGLQRTSPVRWAQFRRTETKYGGTVSDYVMDSYYPEERRNLPPIDQHCQEKNRFFKEKVHLLAIVRKLSRSGSCRNCGKAGVLRT